MSDTVLFYGTKPITDMTREELIEALTETFGMIDMGRESHGRDLNTWRSIINAPSQNRRGSDGP